LYEVVDGDHGFRGASKDTPESLAEMAAEYFDGHLKP
jgi:hypothetical protein